MGPVVQFDAALIDEAEVDFVDQRGWLKGPRPLTAQIAGGKFVQFVVHDGD
jgi:hypothetical protein